METKPTYQVVVTSIADIEAGVGEIHTELTSAYVDYEDKVSWDEYYTAQGDFPVAPVTIVLYQLNPDGTKVELERHNKEDK